MTAIPEKWDDTGIRSEWADYMEAFAKEMAEFIAEHGDELTFGHGLKKEYVDGINAIVDRAQEYLKERT